MLPPSLFAQSVFHLFSMIFYCLYASFLLQIESSLYIASKVSRHFLSILLHHVYILPLIVLHSFGSLFGFSISWRFRLFFISVSFYHLIYSILWNHHLYTYKWRLNCSHFFLFHVGVWGWKIIIIEKCFIIVKLCVSFMYYLEICHAHLK